jgi:hypothetical protein
MRCAVSGFAEGAVVTHFVSALPPKADIRQCSWHFAVLYRRTHCRGAFVDAYPVCDLTHAALLSKQLLLRQ